MAVILCGWDDGNPYSESSAILHRYAGWAAAQIPHVGRIERFGPCTCIAVLASQTIMAAVVYHNHDDRSRALEISMAAATARWATRGTIRALLSYPFEQLGCGVVVCRTPRKAKRTRRFLSGIGFRCCGVVPAGFGDDDCSVYAMTRKDAERWLTATLPTRKAA